MLNFKVIANEGEINLGKSWKREKDKSICQKRTSTCEGRNYQLITMTRKYTPLERIGRGLLGVVLTIVTLLAGPIFSKFIRGLFTDSHKTKQYGILIPDVSNKPSGRTANSTGDNNPLLNSRNESIEQTSPGETNKPIQKTVDSLYKEYFAGQENHLADIAEALSEQLGKNLNSIPQSDAELDQIIFFIEQAQNALNNYESIKQKIDEQSQTDLFLDDTFIEKKFDLTNAFRPLTVDQQRVRRAAIQKVINQAYINRELKQKGKLTTGDRSEKKMLYYLGFKVGSSSNYQNKDLTYGILQGILQNQLRGSSVPLKLFKQSFKDCASEARLKAAGLETSLQKDKFFQAHAHYTNLSQELIQSHQHIQLTLPQDFPLSRESITVRAFERHYERLKSGYTDRALSNFFKNDGIREGFKNSNVNVEDFKQHIDQQKENGLDREELLKKCKKVHENCHSLRKEIAFYHKWGNYIKAELIQGFEDPNEDLGQGVCWGICQRLRFKAQQNPEIKPEELATEVKITAQDRYFQGYMLSHEEVIPEIQKAGYEEEPVFGHLCNGENPILHSELQEWSQSLYYSAGWLKLSIGLGTKGDGHAILVRWDTQRDRYWVIDPEVGYLCFEDDQTSSVEAQGRCLEYLKDLMATYYPDAWTIRGTQLIRV